MMKKPSLPLSMTPLLMALGVGLIPGSAEAQECAEGQINSVEVQRIDVFDLSEFGEDSFARSVFRTANHLHINTSETYIRNELLFEEGSCYDPFLLEESARILRTRIFVKWAEVTGTREPDGDVAVQVRVQDDWSLKLGLGLSFDEGFRLEQLLLQENNLLGTGMTVGVARVQAREVLENYGKFEAPRLFGTDWSFAGTAGATRLGPFVEEEFSFPFTGELSRWAFTEKFEYREDYFSYTTSGVGNPTHVMAPYLRRFAQLTLARRFGEPGRLWVLGGGLSREGLTFPEGPEGIRIVEDERFKDLLPATDAEIQEVSRQTTPLRATRFNLFAGFRNVDFVLRNGLDAVMARQDVQVGSEVTVSVNPALPVLASDGDAEDVYTEARAFWAAASGPWILEVKAQFSGRYVWDAEVTKEGWRDVLSEVDLKGFHRFSESGGHTLFVRAAGARTWSMDRPFQLTAGGREGVRGYSEDAFPGGRRLLFSLEDRFPVISSEILDGGLAFFGDVGRVWGQDVPYGVNSGWRSSVGVGFRVNLPGEALRTSRFDFTLPLSGARDAHGVYFRFYAELGGLLQAPKRPGQVDRSRWSGIDTDLTVSRPPSG
jgi:hypothetical protein